MERCEKSLLGGLGLGSRLQAAAVILPYAVIIAGWEA